MAQPLIPTYDIIGVGFGPSNIALAIALEEIKSNSTTLNALFIDKQPEYQWHGDTITNQSGLQVSFLKDLVTLRNPTSPYSFLNYLHSHNRLVDFINLSTFYPSRLEFNDYLRWVAGHFSSQCQYGEEVTSIEPVMDNQKVKLLKVTTADTGGTSKIRFTKSLVMGTGGTPLIPEVFQPLKQTPLVFHHTHYLSKMAKLIPVKTKDLRIAIIGGGQSAAEAFIDIDDNYPHAKVDLIMRGNSMKPADSSPYVNEIFNPSSTDSIFSKTQQEREELLKEYKYANYSAVDSSMIEQIYNIFYQQKVAMMEQHTYCPNSEVTEASEKNGKITLSILDRKSNQHATNNYDLVILATGYQRPKMAPMLEPIKAYLGNIDIDRNYQVKTDERFLPSLFLQGRSESSHGLSDTLLSILSVRSAEIAHSLQAELQEQAQQAVALA
ncbi:MULTISPECIES: lysine N(6)-hydroxylase/L-ornithine N(5)-oxygenase family protein [Pseudoalteromonas]|uniref:Ornithine monooxygenase n=1 Tax=Pseudoalteromonas fuliginea TaxID=1872678 RepID=A0ABQ6RDW1_9GAMM|nr:MULTISPECIES: SidA/IucD/PvdA family monooxygenase [Pseudoalteromonas]KAA1150937.1 ornithine monooxygenase [Pseudoalteromonas fuliginea]KAA1165610.1 ornithine monooxygenase [Pseudoalteromonas fuliginea]KDC55417.1 ornithine monooxygenase [Pseudoalteromonas sp. S3431]MDQ2042759.1 lysine N(6)-hydroxylase/L-ornithine N(5)-oxygenase family protein [Pseudoalteromonas sp. 20-92]